MEKTEKTLQPNEAFTSIKESIGNITVDDLKATFPNILKMAEKFNKTKQKKAIGRLLFLVRTLEKEQKIVSMGINKFIYKDVIEDYINNVDRDVVKLKELKDYERIIPDEVIDIVDKTTDIFDKFYVVYTDYTGKDERKVEQARRDKDPILFGCFCDLSNHLNRYVGDRFYVLGDWVDEYCDLTLDKMVSKYKEKYDGRTPVNEIVIPKSLDELKVEMNKLEEVTNFKDEKEILYTVTAINDADTSVTNREFNSSEGLLFYRNKTSDDTEKTIKPFFQKIRSFLHI